ncbi:U-actitoxin-Avd3g-like [Rhipicephalus sanguineus]|uniref:U-actitoxin-Avd3g-like n=1 Tax=Rhipicephalus sanguineus TaxID=34632 RepID=UPI0020C2D747|nr:U-actitoxin-Avd3g-like [Rhipicephalus sanguineus]
MNKKSSIIYCALMWFSVSLLAGNMNVFVNSTDPGYCTSPPPNETCENGNPTVMWYYNSTIENCTTYNYTGCGTGVNKFNTSETCLLVCGPHSSPGTRCGCAALDTGGGGA